MSLPDDQLLEIVKTRMSVTHQNTVIAKGLLIKHFNPNSDLMIRSALNELGIRRVDSLVLSGDNTTEVESLADYFSWIACAVEGLWSLIHAGVVFSASSGMSGAITLIPVPTSVSVAQITGTSRYSGSCDFAPVVQIPAYPQSVVKSQIQREGFILTDPDLYLQHVRVQTSFPEITDALEESIRCFRAELYLASATMLGKASEGVWIELGKALIDALPKTEQPKQAPFRAELDNSVRPSFATKLRNVVKLYETSQAQLHQVASIAGFGLDQFRAAYQWAEMVRESRNIVHYGSQPNIPSNYNNTATLLLAGSTHLRNLLSLYAAALASPGA